MPALSLYKSLGDRKREIKRGRGGDVNRKRNVNHGGDDGECVLM